ncbi:MAG TPA: CsgG/HfaB family protein [bacterium]|nr:CsgG/HfaB family protein [bacterium]HPG46925.1 CsgG/HfaB family protein [bacterium]HPM99289.1 CsgG/HfaB family protein [bacterium]
MKNPISMLRVLPILALFMACATTSMNIPVTKPAKINLAGINKIAVGDITGPGSMNLTDELIAQLFNSNRYEILDRQHLDRIFQEHRLSLSGTIDESTAAELGKLFGSAALIFGRVSQHNYTEEMTKKDHKDEKSGKTHRTYERKGKANVAVTLQVTDLRTGKIVAVRNLQKEVSKTTSATDHTPEKIDQEALLHEARTSVLTSFMQDIAPYTEIEKISFISDKNIPQLKAGIDMAKAGNWQQAVKYFKEATIAYPSSPKAFYNLGIAQMWSYNFEQAEAALNKAYELEAKSIYLKEINRCKRLKAEQERLAEQMREAGI